MKNSFTLVEIMIVVGIIGLLAVIVIPSSMRARKMSQATACINNLRQIESAKDQLALEYGLSNYAEVTWADIGPSPITKGPYIKQWPNCPCSSNAALKANEKSATYSHMDYAIGVIQSNAVCRQMWAANPAHFLK
jgi:type II secretory pathway pseudopilin PulG